MKNIKLILVGSIAIVFFPIITLLLLAHLVGDWLLEVLEDNNPRYRR